MNKIMNVALLSALAVAGTGGAFAAPTKSQAAATAQTVVGEISAVNAQSMTFSVKTKDQTENFTLAKQASLISQGKTIHLADLKVGERVEVSYTLDGAARRASSVHVVSQPMKAS